MTDSLDGNQLAPNSKAPEALIQDLKLIIADARRQTATAVNVGLTLLYWRLGDRIRREVLANERAEYGEQIFVTLSRVLVAGFGRGYAKKIFVVWCNSRISSPKRRLS